MRTWLSRGYAIGLVLFAVLGLEAILYFRRYDRRQEALGESREAAMRMEEGMGALIEAVSRERGYLLTGDPMQLEAAKRAGGRAQLLVADLGQLTAGEPEVHRQVDELASAVDARLAFMDRMLALASSGHRDRAVALLRSSEGERLMTRSRTLIESLLSHERWDLLQASARSQADAWRGGLFLAFGNSLALIFITASWLLLKREQLRRRELTQELLARREREVLHARLEQEKQRLDQILQELPVGVCIAEAPSGRIVYNNHQVARIYRGRLPRIESKEDYSRFDIRKGDGAPLAPADNPLVRALEHGETVHGEELRLERPTGETATLKMNAAPLLGPSGNVIAAVAVFDDYTAEKRALDELAQAAHFREMFMSLLGHDLRNPLTVLTTGVQVLRRRAHDERESRILDRMGSSSSRMAHMIDQLIDFTRSRLGGGIPIERQHTDLGQIARHAAHAVEVQADRPIELTADGDTVGEWDPERMAQVVSNLLANAAQHGRTDAPVRAHVHGGAHDVTFEVHNLGPPIPPQFLPVLFDPFRRAAERKRMKSTGLGLGLYLAQQIVAAHGGRIAVDSSEQTGTTFRVILPRTQEP